MKSRSAEKNGPKGGRRYGRFVSRELTHKSKNNIGRRNESEFTGLGARGSALGGPLTLAFGLMVSNVLPGMMLMSPSVWWRWRRSDREIGERSLTEPYAKSGSIPATHDPGGRTRPNYARALIEKGWPPVRRLITRNGRRATHSEGAGAIAGGSRRAVLISDYKRSAFP